ncbi:hypothetical protein BDR03DRAFT_958169 [Suillus americanus]|nr:hypothetical protein BDR03DRAFT_958169 [Suillus americanus]
MRKRATVIYVWLAACIPDLSSSVHVPVPPEFHRCRSSEICCNESNSNLLTAEECVEKSAVILCCTM